MLVIRDTIRARLRRQRQRTAGAFVKTERMSENGDERKAATETEQMRLLLDAVRTHKDTAAFDTLVEMYRDSVFDFARRFLGDDSLAEDVTQEAFMALYRKAATLESNVSLRPWLLGVARFYALERRRMKSRLKVREATYAMRKSDRMIPAPADHI